MTRVPLAPKYLYYFDSVNFALALDHFDPARHQPQPPGYPLFVLFTRTLHLFIAKPEHVFLASGIIAGAIAVLAVWWLAESIFGSKAGFPAALLLLLNPAFWLAGISNQVRLWLAAGMAITALCCWRAITHRARCPWLLPFAAGTAGLVAGFRPALLLFLLPLLIFTAFLARPGARQLAWSGCVLTVSVGCWLCWTAHASGGWQAYLYLLTDYSQREFAPSSILYGATGESAWRMAKAAVIWNGLGMMSWVWILAIERRWPSFGVLAFLAAWALPAFLFHAFVHVGDPDHTLATVPALCVVGGAAFASLSRRLPSEGWLISTLLGATINALLFFLPLGGYAGASTFRAVEYVDHATRETFDAIRRLSRGSSTTILCHGCFITERHLRYYFPQLPILVLPRTAGGRAEQYIGGSPSPPVVRNGAIAVPPSQRVIWLVSPHQQDARIELARKVDLRQEGPVFWHEVVAAHRIRAGGVDLLLSRAER